MALNLKFWVHKNIIVKIDKEHDAARKQCGLSTNLRSATAASSACTSICSPTLV
jgi:hypothetical protein